MIVSVIIASYNKEAYIQETIDSVLNQSYSQFELIIIDDCSTDNTRVILEQAKLDPRVKVLINKTNKGANYCRNTGLSMSNGSYVVFLDADDLLNKDCLKNRMTEAEKYPDTNLLVFTMGVFYKKIGDDKRLWTPLTNHPMRDFLRHKLPWSILQPLWKKNFLEQLVGFDESFQRLQDVELNTRALLQQNVNYKIVRGEADCYYRIDEDRKNFDNYRFLERWVKSAVQYYEKFEKLVGQQNRRYLLGTIYQTRLQMIIHLKDSRINAEQFNNLEKCLWTIELTSNLSVFKKVIFRFSKWYNLHGVRIPGINKLLSLLIIF